MEVKIETGSSDQCAQKQIKSEELSTSEKDSKSCGLHNNDLYSIKVVDNVGSTQSEKTIKSSNSDTCEDNDIKLQ